MPWSLWYKTELCKIKLHFVGDLAFNYQVLLTFIASAAKGISYVTAEQKIYGLNHSCAGSDVRSSEKTINLICLQPPKMGINCDVQYTI